MKCTNCGFVNVDDAVFCEKCGVKMVDDRPKLSIDTIKNTIKNFSDKERKLLMAIFILIVAVPILCGIINRVDRYIENKAYEKEHSVSIEEDSTEETAGSVETEPQKEVSSEDFAKEVINTLVKCDVDGFYEYIDTSDDEVTYLLDKKMMKKVMKHIFNGGTFDGVVTKTDYLNWTFDGGVIEEYEFIYQKKDSTSQTMSVYVLSYTDKNILYISQMINTESFELPNCVEVSFLGNKLQGEPLGSEGKDIYYSKYNISYLNLAGNLPITLCAPGMEQGSDIISAESSYGVSMNSLSVLDKNGGYYDKNLIETIPNTILSSMSNAGCSAEQYIYPSDVLKDETVVEGQQFGESFYGSLFNTLNDDSSKSFKNIEDYTIDAYDIKDDGYLYFEITVKYNYGYISMGELNESSAYATFRYKYMDGQWYLTTADGSLIEEV